LVCAPEPVARSCTANGLLIGDPRPRTSRSTRHLVLCSWLVELLLEFVSARILSAHGKNGWKIDSAALSARLRNRLGEASRPRGFLIGQKFKFCSRFA